MFNIFGSRNRSRQNENDRTFSKPKSVTDQLEEFRQDLLNMQHAMDKKGQRMDKIHKFHHEENMKLKQEIQRLQSELAKQRNTNVQKTVSHAHNYNSNHETSNQHSNEVIVENRNENVNHNNNNATEQAGDRRNSSPIDWEYRDTNLKRWNNQTDLSSIDEDSNSSDNDKAKLKPRRKSYYKMQASAIPILHGRPNEDLDEWIFIIERFFRKNRISEVEKVDIAVDYLKDNALVAY